MVAALGIDEYGRKMILGIRQGATENATVVGELLGDLVNHGLDFTEPRLYILDGGKALSAAVNKHAGESAAIQRCQVHKRGAQSLGPKVTVAQLFPPLVLRCSSGLSQGFKKLASAIVYLPRPSPTSAIVGINSFVCSADMQKSSLHFGDFECCRQVQSQALQ